MNGRRLLFKLTLSFMLPQSEHTIWVYAVRLLTYLLILFAIIDKSRRARPGVSIQLPKPRR